MEKNGDLSNRHGEKWWFTHPKMGIQATRMVKNGGF
jgi:hypothetical protein